MLWGVQWTTWKPRTPLPASRSSQYVNVATIIIYLQYMSNEIAPITTHDVESRIIMVRGQQVILDCDVLYKLTKRKWRNWRENLLLVTGLRSKILIANPSVIKLDTCQRHLQKEVSICWQPSSSHLVQHRPLLPLLILSLKSEQWHVHNRIIADCVWRWRTGGISIRKMKPNNYVMKWKTKYSQSWDFPCFAFPQQIQWIRKR